MEGHFKPFIDDMNIGDLIVGIKMETEKRNLL